MTTDANTAELKARIADLEVQLAFARSPFVKEKCSLPAEFVAATLRKHFEVDGDHYRVVGTFGEQLASLRGLGDPRAFDGALERLLDLHPHRKVIMEGAPHESPGCKTPHAIASAPAPAAGRGPVVTRPQFDAMGAADRMAHAKAGGRVVD